MAIVQVKPGICGLQSKIEVTSEDGQHAKINIKSGCPMILKMRDELKEVDGFNEVFSKFNTSKVYGVANKYISHVACPVPSAILKGIEVACGLALPKEVEFKIEK